MPDRALSLPEVSALVVLMVEAREVSNPELKARYGLTLDGKARLRMNDLKLVDSWKQGRAYVHMLTDAGWARLAEEFQTGTVPAPTGSAGAMIRALWTGLQGFLERTDHRLADVFQPRDVSASPTSTEPAPTPEPVTPPEPAPAPVPATAAEPEPTPEPVTLSQPVTTSQPVTASQPITALNSEPEREPITMTQPTAEPGPVAALMPASEPGSVMATGPTPETETETVAGPAPGPETETDIEVRVRVAYSELAGEPGTWVSLTRLRPLLGDVSRAEVDDMLRRMNRMPDVNIVPESNQKTLTQQDREAAVTIGDQDKHLLSIGVR
ncbi:hypothetical protein [Streptosporangium sp. NPDC006007]|uniref:hypothetical protein n=1 Tax=Streptosporangium sp. NPDC006007 TaxID=3154575 RepID=UPI0033AA3D0C